MTFPSAVLSPFVGGGWRPLLPPPPLLLLLLSVVGLLRTWTEDGGGIRRLGGRGREREREKEGREPHRTFFSD